MIRLLVAFILLAVSVPAYAVLENDYINTMRSVVAPFIDSNLKFSTFQSYDGHSISYGILKVPNSKGTVVISSGRTESYLNYRETMYDFAQLGYSSAIIDHRGQGKSARLTTGSDVGHVEKFSDYVHDFSDFIEKHVETETQGPHYLFAFSMGGAIATSYLVDHPGQFHAVALVSPMIKIRLSTVQSIFIGPTLGLLSLFKSPTDYAPTVGPYDAKADVTLGNPCTSSDIRYDFHKMTLQENPFAIIGGSSMKWLKESFSATKKIRLRAKELRDPILIVQGEDDPAVDPKAQVKLCNEAPNCRLFVAPKARHCPHVETDPLREKVLKEIVTLFETGKAKPDLDQTPNQPTRQLATQPSESEKDRLPDLDPTPSPSP